MRHLLFSAMMMAATLTSSAQTAQFSFFQYSGNDTRFQQDFNPTSQYLNPILAGFYPDPSICRAGDTYYLVNSSFAFFPGVPTFESKDLVHWTQVGHVLDRASQLPLEGQGVSAGIFAPDIKYNEKNKTFYMITTNVGRGNFFVKTQDPHQGWSEPVYLHQIDGIDPSFFFDSKSGRAFIVHNAPVEGGHDYEGQRAIRILEFDINGDSIITAGTPNRRGWYQIVRGGTHVSERPIWIEGPHLYRIGKFYYLMCAEGGTGDAHSEVIFRASVKADITKADSWEECPHNPILTQRDLYNYQQNPYLPHDAVTSTGHADLVMTPNGDWYAVFLGCRAYNGPYYNTGRDTYMLPVTWKDGWPTILPHATPVPAVVDKPGLLAADNLMTGNFSYTDRFNDSQLAPRWIFLRNPSTFYQTGSGLTLTPKAVNIAERKSPSAIFCRQQHTNFTAETEVRFSPQSKSDLAGLVLLQNEDYHFVLGLTKLDNKLAVTLTRREKAPVLIASALIENDKPVRLKIEGQGRYYSFYYALEGGEWQPLAVGTDAINLSTAYSGGFIGTCIGLYATSAN
ncbi:MAG: glycoside hydrolase family 43 protein [Bacteroidaceae bacterium]|nr:glycoside hydrolase family 43 protein [Bacteroidaceae bacterium]